MNMSRPRINNVRLRAGFHGSDWLANIDARELSGDVHWRSQGKGRVSAQLSHFTFPEPTPGKAADDVPPKELPGLDIVADNLVVHEKKLGRLELTAANAGLDWRIEKLTLTTPESKLSADGLWQTAAQQRLAERGLQIGTVPAEVQAQFAEISRTMAEEWVQRAGEDGRKLVDALRG